MLEARRLVDVELAEQRSQRLADRRAAVYIDLTRFLLAQDAKLYDNHPLDPRVRTQPLEIPHFDDANLDVQLRAFASEDVLRLVEEWRKYVSIVVKLIGDSQQQTDDRARSKLEEERDWNSTWAHDQMVKVQEQIRLEGSPNQPGQ